MTRKKHGKVTRRLVSVAFVVCLTVLLNDQPGRTFDSFPGGKIHRDITNEALKDLGFSKDALQRVVKKNYGQDRDETDVNPGKGLIPGGKGFLSPNDKYRSEHHFDRNKGDTHKDAFKRGSKYLKEQRDEIINKLKD